MTRLVVLFSFCYFALLAFLFPYTGDDWDWGGMAGIQRLMTLFDNYNGRYAGNFLVLALTRSKLADALVMAASYTLACLLCHKYCGSKTAVSLLFATFLFFAMPAAIFREAVVWTSGYTNYVPSALISVLYIVLVKNITEEALPRYPKFLFVGTFLMGVVGALFMENVTLFNVCLAVAVIGYTFLKHKTHFSAHYGFLAGAIVGCVIMFSNSAYHTIAQGTDQYRETPQGMHQTIEYMKGNAVRLSDYLILNNDRMCLIVSVLLVLLALQVIRQSQGSGKKWVIRGCVLVNLVSLMLVFLNEAATEAVVAAAAALSIPDGIRYAVQLMITAVYVLSVFGCVWLCVEKKSRFQILMPFYCVPVSLVPLLVVHPIGPRCAFIGYLLMMVFLTALFVYVKDHCRISNRHAKVLLCSLCAVILLQMGQYLGIYYPVYQCEQQRSAFIAYQISSGADTIRICDLPQAKYLHNSVLSNDLQRELFRIYHGVKPGTPLQIVSSEEMTELMESAGLSH